MARLLRLRYKKGFTLVEIIIVLVILAILAAIMIPSFTGYIDKAKERVILGEARGMWMAAQTALSEMYALGRIGNADIKHKDCLKLPDGTMYKPAGGYVGRFTTRTISAVQKDPSIVTKNPNNTDYKMAYAMLQYIESEDKKNAMYDFCISLKAGKDPCPKNLETISHYTEDRGLKAVVTVYYGGDGKMKILQFGKDGYVATMYDTGKIDVEKDGKLMGDPCNCPMRS